MSHDIEPMDVDEFGEYSSVLKESAKTPNKFQYYNDFDNKENSCNVNIADDRFNMGAGDKTFDAFDDSCTNMKLRWSCTPGSSPAINRSAYDSRDRSMNNSLNDNINSTFTAVDFENGNAILSSHRYSSDVQGMDMSLDNSRITIVEHTSSTNISLDSSKNNTLLQDNSVESKKVPKISFSSVEEVNQNTSPLSITIRNDNQSNSKDYQGASSPILRGIKSVMNMFRPSQSPILPSETTPNCAKNLKMAAEQPSPTANKSNEKLTVTPEIKIERKNITTNKTFEGETKKQDSLEFVTVFKEDFINDIQWNDDSTIIFNSKKLKGNRSLQDGESQSLLSSSRLSSESQNMQSRGSSLSKLSLNETYDNVDHSLSRNKICSESSSKSIPEGPRNEMSESIQNDSADIDVAAVDKNGETLNVDITESKLLENRSNQESCLDTVAVAALTKHILKDAFLHCGNNVQGNVSNNSPEKFTNVIVLDTSNITQLPSPFDRTVDMPASNNDISKVESEMQNLNESKRDSQVDKKPSISSMALHENQPTILEDNLKSSEITIIDKRDASAQKSLIREENNSPIEVFEDCLDQLSQTNGFELTFEEISASVSESFPGDSAEKCNDILLHPIVPDPQMPVIIQNFDDSSVKTADSKQNMVEVENNEIGSTSFYSNTDLKTHLASNETVTLDTEIDISKYKSELHLNALYSVVENGDQKVSQSNESEILNSNLSYEHSIQTLPVKTDTDLLENISCTINNEAVLSNSPLDGDTVDFYETPNDELANTNMPIKNDANISYLVENTVGHNDTFENIANMFAQKLNIRISPQPDSDNCEYDFENTVDILKTTTKINLSPNPEVQHLNAPLKEIETMFESPISKTASGTKMGLGDDKMDIDDSMPDTIILENNIADTVSDLLNQQEPQRDIPSMNVTIEVSTDCRDVTNFSQNATTLSVSRDTVKSDLTDEMQSNKIHTSEIQECEEPVIFQPIKASTSNNLVTEINFDASPQMKTNQNIIDEHEDIEITEIMQSDGLNPEENENPFMTKTKISMSPNIEEKLSVYKEVSFGTIENPFASHSSVSTLPNFEHPEPLTQDTDKNRKNEDSTQVIVPIEEKKLTNDVAGYVSSTSNNIISNISIIKQSKTTPIKQKQHLRKSHGSKTLSTPPKKIATPIRDTKNEENIDFQTIDDPFATRTTIRMSPTPNEMQNKSMENLQNTSIILNETATQLDNTYSSEMEKTENQTSEQIPKFSSSEKPLPVSLDTVKSNLTGEMQSNKIYTSEILECDEPVIFQPIKASTSNNLGAEMNFDASCSQMNTNQNVIDEPEDDLTQVIVPIEETKLVKNVADHVSSTRNDTISNSSITKQSKTTPNKQKQHLIRKSHGSKILSTTPKKIATPITDMKNDENIDFETIDDPFATRTTIRMSPTPNEMQNKSMKNLQNTNIILNETATQLDNTYSSEMKKTENQTSEQIPKFSSSQKPLSVSLDTVKSDLTGEMPSNEIHTSEILECDEPVIFQPIKASTSNNLYTDINFDASSQMKTNQNVIDEPEDDFTQVIIPIEDKKLVKNVADHVSSTSNNTISNSSFAKQSKTSPNKQKQHLIRKSHGSKILSTTPKKIATPITDMKNEENIDFETIDNPFATRTTIRMSPTLNEMQNKCIENLQNTNIILNETTTQLDNTYSSEMDIKNGASEQILKVSINVESPSKTNMPLKIVPTKQKQGPMHVAQGISNVHEEDDLFITQSEMRLSPSVENQQIHNSTIEHKIIDTPQKLASDIDLKSISNVLNETVNLNKRNETKTIDSNDIDILNPFVTRSKVRLSPSLENHQIHNVTIESESTALNKLAIDIDVKTISNVLNETVNLNTTNKAITIDSNDVDILNPFATRSKVRLSPSLENQQIHNVTIESESTALHKLASDLDVKTISNVLNETAILNKTNETETIDSNDIDILNPFAARSKVRLSPLLENEQIQKLKTESEQISVSQMSTNDVNQTLKATKTIESNDIDISNPFVTQSKIRTSPSVDFTVINSEKITMNSTIENGETTYIKKSDSVLEISQIINKNEPIVTTVGKSEEQTDNSLNSAGDQTFDKSSNETILHKAQQNKSSSDNLAASLNGLPLHNEQKQLASDDVTMKQDESDEEFAPAEMFFKDTTIDYLMNQKSTTTDRGKDSLFIKFDPLYVANGKSNVEKIDAASTSGNAPSKNRLSDSFHEKPVLAVSPAVNSDQIKPIVQTPPRQESSALRFVSPAIAAIDKLISQGVSPVRGSSPAMLVDLRDMSSVNYFQQQMETAKRLLSEREEEYNKKISDLEKSNAEHVASAKALEAKLLEQSKQTACMIRLHEEYEHTFVSLLSKHQDEKKKYEEEISRLMRERDEQGAHLSSMELSFNDIHAKYEKCKSMILSFKSNEEVLKKRISDNEAHCKKLEEAYEQIKKHATTKLNVANQTLETMKKTHQNETFKLNSLIKRKELENSSLQETLMQKTKDNEALESICDEILNKV